MVATISQAEQAVPAGFSPLQTTSGFVQGCGGFYLHDQQPILAARVGPDHLNSLRIAHGGFLATVADCAFGAVFRRLHGVPALTVHLDVDYIDAVREGAWLEAHVQVHKVGGRFANASCLLQVGERLVLRASGIFTQWKGKLPASA